MIGGPISFLTDYGLEDEFVGVVHRVIAGRRPGRPGHRHHPQIPAHDVRAGALTLWRAAPWLAPGWSWPSSTPAWAPTGERWPSRSASARCGAGRPGQRAAPPGRPRSSVRSPARSSCPPATDGPSRRCAGARPSPAGTCSPPPCARAGRRVSTWPSSGRPDRPGRPRRRARSRGRTARGGGVRAEVLWVDRFGNAQLNAGPADAEHLGPVDLRAAGRRAGVAGAGRADGLRRARPPAEVGSGHRLLRAAVGQLSTAPRPRPGSGWRAGDSAWIGAGSAGAGS